MFGALFNMKIQVIFCDVSGLTDGQFTEIIQYLRKDFTLSTGKILVVYVIK